MASERCAGAVNTTASVVDARHLFLPPRKYTALPAVGLCQGATGRHDAQGEKGRYRVHGGPKRTDDNQKDETMTKTFGQDLIDSLDEALAHAKQKKTGARVYKIEVPDVRAIRERLHMSQHEFARAYHIPLPTLKGWEQGRRQPDATAAAFLNVIAELPKEILAVLSA